jgi:cytidylate kinase
MPVVTISGQAGTGAREIGRTTAALLKLDYVDQEILVESAGALGVPVESVVTHDERTAGLGERVGSMLRRFLERSAVGATDPMMGPGGLDVILARSYSDAAAGEDLPEVSDEKYIQTLTAIIHEVAEHKNVLIIGRGSQVILRDWPDAVHVLLVAPRKQRIEFIEQRDGLSAEDAEKRVEDGDKGRASFHHKFFKINVDDPARYHFALNVGKLSNEAAAEIIGDMARRLAGAGTPPS